MKTRTLAQALVEGGKVRVNKEKVRNSARALREGDVLTLRLARDVRVVRVIGFAERRVSPPQTALLYEALTPDE